MSEFVHLRVHSDRSLLCSTASPGMLSAAAARLGFRAMALTDTHHMSGAMVFSVAMREAGCRPITGLEIHLHPAGFSAGKGSGATAPVPPCSLVLLAMDEDGYRNLLRLSTLMSFAAAQTGGALTFEQLAAHSRGLVALSGGPSGEAGQWIQRGETELARAALARCGDIFSGGRFFVELQFHSSVAAVADKERAVNRELITLARELDLPLVVTNDVHMVSSGDYPVLQVLRAIALGVTLDRLPPFLTPDHDLKPAARMWSIWGRHLPEALANTVRVAEMASFVPTPGPAFLPSFNPPAPHTAESFLSELCHAGLHRYRVEGRLTADWDDYLSRLTRELEVIQRMGYAGYFLVVWDVVQHARQLGIPVGPGRGSVGGSLTAWTLGLTEIDPLAHGLLFERFLNPERVSLPDIDIDFCRHGRSQILGYVAARYGSRRVAQIATLGTFGARQALRDVARVSGLSIAEANRFAELLPPPERGRAVSLDEAARNVPLLRRNLEGSPRLRGIFDLARRIEGLVRHTSVHASGVVISPCDIVELAPLMPLKEGRTSAGVGQAVQYPLESLEDAGLVKMDFLALKALTIVEDVRRRVSAECGVDIDPTRLPDADPKALELFVRGELLGVFQFEGEGISSLSRQLAPRSRADIAVLGALYRPGPLDSGLVGDYLARRREDRKSPGSFPELESILAPTHGVPVYQEQIMAVFQTLAGYSAGEADIIRRAMGKKQRDVLEQHRTRFVSRAMARGYPREALETLWRQLEGFADYAFNKCVDGGQLLLTSEGWLTVAEAARRHHGNLLAGANAVCVSSRHVCGEGSPPEPETGVEPGPPLELWSWDGATCIRQPVVDIFPSGEQEVWEVVLDTGQILRVTPEHRFLTRLAEGKEMYLPLMEIVSRQLPLLRVSPEALPSAREDGFEDRFPGLTSELECERLVLLLAGDVLPAVVSGPVGPDGCRGHPAALC